MWTTRDRQPDAGAGDSKFQRRSGKVHSRATDDPTSRAVRHRPDDLCINAAGPGDIPEVGNPAARTSRASGRHRGFNAAAPGDIPGRRGPAATGATSGVQHRLRGRHSRRPRTGAVGTRWSNATAVRRIPRSVRGDGNAAAGGRRDSRLNGAVAARIPGHRHPMPSRSTPRPAVEWFKRLVRRWHSPVSGPTSVSGRAPRGRRRPRPARDRR